MVFLASTGLTDAITALTGAVSGVVTMATTGDLAVFFWSGIVVTAIGIMSQLKH